MLFMGVLNFKNTVSSSPSLPFESCERESYCNDGFKYVEATVHSSTLQAGTIIDKRQTRKRMRSRKPAVPPAGLLEKATDDTKDSTAQELGRQKDGPEVGTKT